VEAFLVLKTIRGAAHRQEREDDSTHKCSPSNEYQEK